MDEDYEEVDDYESASEADDEEEQAGQGVMFMSYEDLNKEMNDIISEVAMILRIKPGSCRILLHKFNWNKESLLERFYENPDTNSFLRQADVLPKKCLPRPFSTTGDCDICCTKQKLSGLECHHWYCSTCWQMYLQTKIMTDNTSEIQCLANGCHLLVEDEKVMSYIESEQVRAVYRKLMTDSFVDSNRLLKWCPGLDCNKAAKVSHAEPRPVVCSCGTRFCFGCGLEYHEPVDCRLLKLWLKKCSDDSETSNWINANTKDCPKCQVIIEKNGGCNHMTCKNSACRHEFCWICLGNWKAHQSSYFNCNRFDDTAAKQARDAQELSRASLQKYLHYYNRFMNHQQSLRLESKLYATVKDKMDQMQQQSMSWVEVQFLKKAVDVLSDCRRTLMYTYTFAYYLKKDNQTEIFEDNQKDLEMATEQLSEFLERDLQDENLITLKQKVQDKYRYVDHRRMALLSHCQEGTEKESWNYTA